MNGSFFHLQLCDADLVTKHVCAPSKRRLRLTSQRREDENEFRAATCLCGSIQCRGSFLYYAGEGAFASIIKESHSPLHRSALVLRACADPVLTEAERDCLNKHGAKSSALGGLPAWLKKWTALVLQFVDFERDALAQKLLASSARRARHTDSILPVSHPHLSVFPIRHIARIDSQCSVQLGVYICSCGQMFPRMTSRLLEKNPRVA